MIIVYFFLNISVKSETVSQEMYVTQFYFYAQTGHRADPLWGNILLDADGD